MSIPDDATRPAPVRRPRTPRPAPAPVPLGSLSQGDDQLILGGAPCTVCGSELLTHVRMVLGDGTPVVFVSCHRCEERSWLTLDELGRPTAMSRDDVLARSARR